MENKNNYFLFGFSGFRAKTQVLNFWLDFGFRYEFLKFIEFGFGFKFQINSPVRIQV